MPLADLVEPESTEAYINRFLSSNPNSQKAFEAAVSARQASDKGKVGAQRDLNLRDAEHALYTQADVDAQPLMGRLRQLYQVPAYAGLKTLAQNYGQPGIANAIARPVLGPNADLANSTKPDLRELYWGLKPVFSSIKSAPRDVYGRGENPDQP